jgi:class 3 adenylate cyclase
MHVSWSTTLKNRQQIRARVEADEEIAVMFSDIRGFTSYTAREGDRAAYQLAQLHESLLRERIEESGGIIVKTMGDGIMAAFSKISQGIHAAVTVQRAIRSRNKETPKEPIDVGIGLASGTPIMTEADLIGNSVNLSQRVSSLAKGGQILVTEKIKREVLPLEGLHYIPHGKHELKGLGEEFLYEVTWMSEVARLSDGEDHLTLVLTERGTIVVELAKEIQEHLEDVLAELESAEKNEGAFSIMLQRGIARFTQTAIDKSLNAAGIMREQDLDLVNISFHGRNVLVKSGKKTLHLRNVDPDTAADFRVKFNALKERSDIAKGGDAR